MRAWRAKLGFMVPAENSIFESEMHAMAPEGVAVLTTRLYGPTEASEEGIIKTLETKVKEVERATKELSAAKVDAIAFGCTSGSFYKGTSWDKELIKKMEKVGGIKATTTSTSILEALKKMNIRNVGVATPYVKRVNDLLKDFLEKNGLKVLSTKGLGCTSSYDMLQQPPHVAYQLSKKVNRQDIDGILIPCTGFQAIDAIEPIEKDLRKPVVTANQATFWFTLRMAGVHERIDGYGRLTKEF